MNKHPLDDGCECDRNHSGIQYARPSKRYHEKDDYFSDDGNYVQRKQDKE